ncbi:MAG: DUF4347 domain-containing protein [Rhodopila sp.]|nr:DUF4347 domain-containing protein [Rhodopila sp.]
MQQIVFIDGSVPDAELLAAGVAPGVRAVILDSGTDGVQQIAAYLISHNIRNLTNLDIVAHGQDAQVTLGTGVLSTDTIAQYQAELAAIGAALAPGGDIQIYGCDVAQDAAGTAFLDQLSAATGGASIAASSHLVGSAADGGNWTLDVNVGKADVALPFTAAAAAAYPDVLSTSSNQLFVVYNSGLSTNTAGTRVEQFGVNNGTFVSGSTIDIVDQAKDPALIQLDGLAIDAPLKKYFVVNADNDSVNQIMVGTIGSAAAPTVLYSVGPGSDGTTPTEYINGLALDQAGGWLYFTEDTYDTDGNNIPSTDGIYRISVNGGTPTLIVSGASFPESLALDVPHSLVFFTDTLSGIPINNLDVGTLTPGGSAQVLNGQLPGSLATLLATGGADLGGVAVDSAAQILYFTTYDDLGNPTAATNLIESVHYTVSGGHVTLTPGTFSTLYSGAGAGSPQSITIDPQNGVFYVVNDLTQAIESGSLTHTGSGSASTIFPYNSVDGGPNNGGNPLPSGIVLLSTPTIVASGTVSYVQATSPILINPTATLVNSDGQGLASATVQIVNGTTNDVLSATTTGTSITQSYNAATGMLTLSGADTLAHYQTVLDSVKFSTTSTILGARTINWTVSDGVITSATPTSTVNEVARLTVMAGASASFTGGGTAATLDSGLSIVDQGGSVLAGATVVVGGFITGDTLTVGSAGGLTASFNNGTLTLSGSASVATYQAALDSVSYSFSPANGDPTGGGTHKSRTISWLANDGTVSSAVTTSTLNVIHAPPTISAGATVSFTGGSGTTTLLDSALVLADADSGGTLTGATISIGGFISGDTLTFVDQNGIAGSYNSTTGVETLGGAASVANYQTALESIAYGFNPSNGDPTGGGNHTSRTITWTVNDGVATGSATSTLNAVHVAGTATASGTVTYTGTAVALDTGLTVADSDSGGNLTGAAVTIGGFQSGDTLQFTNQNGISGSFNAGTLTLSGTATLANYQTALESVKFATTSAVQSVRTINWTIQDGASTSSASTSSIDVICFCVGTLIGTPAGEVQVEKLQAGDMVLTAHNGPRKVKWIGTGKVLATRGRRTAATPVIVRKGALADNVPNQDLRVTKAHGLYLDDVLIPVEFLVNHKTILWDDRAQEVEIYHVELDSHDLLLANGAPAESYRDDGNRWLFQNANSGWHLPPQEPYVPVLTGGPVVDAVWRRLLDRAGPRHLPPMTDDPDLHLMVDGQRIDPVESNGLVRVFRLGSRPEHVHVASREVAPAELGLSRDPRSLGVALRRVVLCQGRKVVAIEADDVRLTVGFQNYEPADDLRWTDGYAALPIEAFAPFTGPMEVVLTLAATTTYPDYGDGAKRVAA